MLDILPGLETSAVFQPDMEGLIHRLFSWAEKSSEPLQSYSTGLLAAAMEVQDIATGFREQNARMVPLMLKRLHKLQEKATEERRQLNAATRPFAHFGHNRSNSILSDSEKKSFPGKRKIKDKKQENGSQKSSHELSDYSSTEDEADDELTREDSSTMPAMKKIKSESKLPTTPVKKDNSYPNLMSPPASVPPNTSKNNGNDSQVFIYKKKKNNCCFVI